MEFGMWQILWLACGVATIVASMLATKDRLWLYVGRASVGVLFLVGGVVLHVINLVKGADYSGFADPAHFAWVTDAWEAVVPPNPVLWIGLLIVFEAAVGVLVLSGGRRTQFGYAAALAFYLALTLFGGIQLAWFVVMLAPMLLLLRAERRAASPAPAVTKVEEKPLADVGF